MNTFYFLCKWGREALLSSDTRFEPHCKLKLEVEMNLTGKIEKTSFLHISWGGKYPV